MDASSRLIIDLDAIAGNVRAMRTWLPAQTGFAAVVKADAYGLGAIPVSQAVIRAGASVLAVYDAGEAAELVAAGVDAPVMILGPLSGAPGDRATAARIADAAARGRLHLTAHGPAELDVAERLAIEARRAVPVHLEIDTGMSRGGCPPTQAPRLVDRILRTPGLALAGIFTHMADPDDGGAVDEQLEIFRSAIGAVPAVPGSCRMHVANTRTVLRQPRLAADLVRCGQALAGYGTIVDEPGVPAQPTLQRAVRWVSRIARVREIEPGATVGYGRRWTATRRSRIGLVPVGYADGYPRPLGMMNGPGEPAAPGTAPRAGAVGLGDDGQGRPRTYAPVVGAISMDQLTVDLTDVDPADAGPGAAVELFGRDPDSPTDVAALAASAGTTHYELLSRLGRRVARTHVGASGRTTTSEPAPVAAAVETGLGRRSRRAPGAMRPVRPAVDGTARVTP